MSAGSFAPPSCRAAEKPAGAPPSKVIVEVASRQSWADVVGAAWWLVLSAHEASSRHAARPVRTSGSRIGTHLGHGEGGKPPFRNRSSHYFPVRGQGPAPRWGEPVSRAVGRLRTVTASGGCRAADGEAGVLGQAPGDHAVPLGQRAQLLQRRIVGVGVEFG